MNYYVKHVLQKSQAYWDQSLYFLYTDIVVINVAHCCDTDNQLEVHDYGTWADFPEDNRDDEEAMVLCCCFPANSDNWVVAVVAAVVVLQHLNDVHDNSVVVEGHEHCERKVVAQ